MNSIIINQQGSHKVKGNGFGKFAEYIYSVIRDAASYILHGASVLACVVLAVALLSSCGDDKDAPTPGDTTAPVIKVVSLSVDISGGKQLQVKGNELYVGDVLVASWTDNVTQGCKVELTLNSKPVSSGTTISEGGVLTLKVTDAAGNSKTLDIILVNVEKAPVITVNKYEVNVFGGVAVALTDSQLLLDDEVIAVWTDENLQGCRVALTLNGNAIGAGAVVNEAGKMKLTVTNRYDKSAVAEIVVTNDAIYGLETLRQAQLKVDQEVNLLNGLTFAEGVELIKTDIEISGKRTNITEPSHYVPEYPGVCNIIFIVKGKNGNSVECWVDNLMISALDYNAPAIATANMISEHYSWYNNLQSSTRQFIYPHLLASYAACNWSKQNNRVHVIMGETANTDDIENIGSFSFVGDHGYEGYYRIRAFSPEVSIKACFSWSKFEEYVNNHPNDFFVVSCAKDLVGGSSWNQLNGSDGNALRRLLQNENVVISVANSNRSQYYRKTYNEMITNGNNYNSGSINSNKNNKITVVGYNTSGYNNFFSPKSTNVGLDSSMPIGYKMENGNIVMPMAAIVGLNNLESTTTASSFPTAVISGIIGNAISIVMSNHPGITAEDAMTIIVNNYLIEEKFQYKDESTNYNLVDGGEWYFIDMQKLLDVELLQSKAIDNVQFNSDLVKLPSGKGLCYVGKGIQFEYNGQKYDATSANQAVLNQALKSGTVSWYWNKVMARKYGVSASAQLDVYVVDKDGKKIPDLHLPLTKSVR